VSRTEAIRTVIVDDHRVVREGLRAMLDGIDDVAIVGEAEDAAGALGAVGECAPEVVLLDLRLQGESGLDICRLIAEEYPDVKVVFLTVYEDEQYVFEALRAGARGYMLKKASPEDIVGILRSVRGGDIVIDPSLGGQIALRAASMRVGDSWPGVHLGLTRREGDVLDELVKGLNNRQIAQALYISEDTVKTHVRAVLRKLGVRDRAGAVSFALRNGLAS
jgi:DNA-binding NarL/FixJ family response regulator